MNRTALFVLGLAVCSSCFVGPVHADDDYTIMPGYLANTRIDGNTLRGTTGASAVNMAAGDLNQQANLRAFASGGATIQSRQTQQDNYRDKGGGQGID